MSSRASRHSKAPAARPEPASDTWQEAMRTAVRDPRELCRLLGLPPQIALAGELASRDFSVFVPRGYLARMRRGDAADPLLRQVLPLADERAEAPGFGLDPLGERFATRSPGLLHKYRSRVLMVTTGVCAVHCRYCFRRHFPYAERPKSLAEWAPAVAQIEADATLREVIFSGGDPLTLVDQRLAELVERLAQIEHLRRLRIHTRLPIVIPERVTAELLAWLTGTRLTPVMVIHANHPRELDRAVGKALLRLARSGVLLLNQAVLLRGINDDVEVLAELSERLVDMRVTPYYLHQLDRVAGAAHFEVSPARGRWLMSELRARLPGYAVPRYVREVHGATHKLVLA